MKSEMVEISVKASAIELAGIAENDNKGILFSIRNAKKQS